MISTMQAQHADEITINRHKINLGIDEDEQDAMGNEEADVVEDYNLEAADAFAAEWDQIHDPATHSLLTLFTEMLSMANRVCLTTLEEILESSADPYGSLSSSDSSWTPDSEDEFEFDSKQSANVL